MFKDFFEINPNRIIKKVQLPNTSDHITIIDNIYLDPEKVTWLANNFDYSGFRKNGQFKRYIGERARVSIFQDALMREMYLNSDLSLPISTFQPIDTLFTRFRMDYIDDMDARQFVPHVDNDSIVSGVLYLSKENEFKYGGTAFYKHIPSEIYKLPYHPDKKIMGMMRDQNLDPMKKSEYVQFIKNLMYTDLDILFKYQGYTGIPESNSCWDLLYITKPKYNSLLIFPAMIFHSPVIYAPEQRIIDRLTQNLFLRVR